MKIPREKIATAIGVVKVIIAGYGVLASARNLIESVREMRTGRSRKVLYIDAGDIPADKMQDYLAEADRHLRASREGSEALEIDSSEEPVPGGYASRRRRGKNRLESGYAGRTRRRKY